MFYVYVLKSKKDHNLYIGFTNDLKRRLGDHNKGKVKSTKPRIPFELIYYEAYKSETDARKREIKLKKHSQTKEILLNSIENSNNHLAPSSRG